MLGDFKQRKEPITPGHLFALQRELNRTIIKEAEVFAAALIMFFGLLRRSNVLGQACVPFDPSKHLRRRDILLTGVGLSVIIRWSKTDQFRSKVRTIPLPRLKGHPLCPSTAVFLALSLSPGAPPDGPLFPSISPESFTRRMLKVLEQAGYDPKDLGSHSYRRGGATILWTKSNVGEAKIRALGDWSSNAHMLYTVSDSKDLGTITQAIADVLPASD